MARHDDPAPGTFVDAGGHRLHILCRGHGQPTVVMDSALGGFAFDWSLVQPEIAKFTRVCAYDRAGYAWSEPNPQAPVRTSGQLAHELHTLLETAGISPPYVLVGHSFGGWTVRLFADRFPGEVLGMVLVDAAPEDIETHLKLSTSSLASRLNFLARLVGIGVIRKRLAPGVMRSMIPDYKHLPPQVWARQAPVALKPESFRTAAREVASLRESAAQVRAARRLGDLPLLVLTPGSSSPVWMELQKDLAGLSTQGKLIRVEGAGHYIQLGRPDVVIEAVRQVVEAARRRLIL
jgi:pimeloyl-ACP methyl ester carboxylesterase